MAFSGACHKERCEYCEINAIDNGWFYRYHINCLDSGCTGDEASKDVLIPLLIYSFICGLGWIIAGVLACLGSMRTSKCITLTSMIIFSTAFLAFVISFAIVWNQVLSLRSDCLNDQCGQFKDKANGSSNDFLGYSICAFILIPLCISFTLISYFSIANHEYLASKKEKINPNMDRKAKLGMGSEVPGDTKMEIDATQLGQENEPDDKATEMQEKEPKKL